MANAWHVQWLAEGVSRWNARRKSVRFTPDLSGINFRDHLPKDFRDSPKTSRYFEKIDLRDCDLSEADMSHMNFSRAKFSGANLNNARLEHTNFTKAVFAGTSLRSTSFDGSILTGTTFKNCDLTDTDFGNANLQESNLSSVTLTSEQGHRLRLSMSHQKARSISIEDGRANSALYTTTVEDDFSKSIIGHSPPQVDDRTPKNRYQVFYGTTRAPIIERGAVTGFGGERATSISYGVCEVIIPESRKIGSLGSPLWKRLLNRKDDRIHLEHLIPLNQDIFSDHLTHTAKVMKIKERPTIFVHGYRNSFEDAVLRAAQIGSDLGLGQGIGLFSWPSKNTLLGYAADGAACDASAFQLADFIETFIDSSPEKSVNLIAHSMGCRCLVGAFEKLANGRKNILKRVNQVVLAAADIDSGVMPNIASQTVRYFSRTTSYVSDRDDALRISGWLHQFPRVGISPPLFTHEFIDTVIVNDWDLGEFSHGYVGSSRLVLSDIYQLIKHGHSPDYRHGLELVSGNEPAHWRMRD